MRYVKWAWGLLCLVVVLLFAIPIDNGADSVYGGSTWFIFVVLPVTAVWAIGLGLMALVGAFTRGRRSAR
jgi:hypothetical protein